MTELFRDLLDAFDEISKIEDNKELHEAVLKIKEENDDINQRTNQ